MLLDDTGTALTSLSRVRAESLELSWRLTRVATSILVTRREAVSTSRVGSEDCGMRPGSPTAGIAVLEMGVTSKSASAVYCLLAVST